jgi:hypothetical protein
MSRLDAAEVDVGSRADTGTIALAGSEESWLVRPRSIDRVPADFSQTTIELLAADEVGVMRPVRTVTVTKGDGAFSISPVPTGPRYLVLKSDGVSTVGIETESDQVDFGESLYGRGDAVYGGVFLEFRLMNLAPLEDAYPVQPLGAGTFVPVFPRLYIYPPPSVGATSIVGTSDPSLVLSDTSKGDFFRIGQWVTERTAEMECWTLDRVYDPGPITMVEGAHVELRGGMVQLPREQIVTVEWDRDAFAAVSAGSGAEIDLDVYGSVASGGRIAWDEAALHHCTAPLIALAPTTTLRFADPYPAGWGMYFRYAVRLDDARRIEGFQIVDRSTLRAAPVISPVREVEINEGAVVHLRWRPPSVGVATLYRVRMGGSLEHPLPGYFDLYTEETEIALPTELVRRGLGSSVHPLTITAFAGQTSALSTSPTAGGAAHYHVGR